MDPTKPSPPSDPLKSPVKPRPSDPLSIKTPQKLPIPPRRTKTRRQPIKLPDKCEVLLRFYDAMEASLKLLRMRKSIPVFSKIKVMVENISDRRFTHQHLAQLKFLLPEEIGLKKVLHPDEKTHCMKHDLHLILNINMLASSRKRKRGSKTSCLRDRLISRLLDFVRSHPEDTEIPEQELPEPFNQRKQAPLLNTVEQSSLSTCMQKNSNGESETVPAPASLLPMTFRKHFSKAGLTNAMESSFQSSPVQSPSTAVSFFNGDELKLSQTLRCQQAAVDSKHSPAVGETSFIQAAKTQVASIKSAGTPAKPATPALREHKISKLSPDSRIISSACEEVNRPSCARSLQFEGDSRNANIELQSDEAECCDILEILPENLLQSLKEKEKGAMEHTKRKQMIARLPKMFDRIQLLFQSPKSSAIKKEMLIRDLTECHSDITDEGEVEEQLKLLQEIIPTLITRKFSPSGNLLYSINKALDPKILRLQLNQVV